MAKVEKLKIEGRTKHYKKFLLTKIFKEDENNLPKYKKLERQTILAKLKINVPQTEEDDLDPIQLIKLVDDGFISDLKPEEIPDD